jgi:hypothetical protein
MIRFINYKLFFPMFNFLQAGNCKLARTLNQTCTGEENISMYMQGSTFAPFNTWETLVCLTGYN